MSTRLGWFALGLITATLGILGGVYLFVRAGGVSMETTARPLPLERTVARLALRASLDDAAGQKDPLPPTEANMLAGARVYRGHCGMCHGYLGRPVGALATAMFPHPPPLFEDNGMVIDDPEGVTHWKVTHGIRLSGMPGFASVLTDRERWQVTMLVAHAKALPPPVREAVTGAVDAAETGSGR